MSPTQLLTTTMAGLLFGAALSGGLWVFGADMPAHGWAAVVCWVTAAVVCARNADPVEPRHWMRW